MQCYIKGLVLRFKFCCHFVSIFTNKHWCCKSLLGLTLLCRYFTVVSVTQGDELSLLCPQTSARTQKLAPSTRLETPGRSTSMGSDTSATAMVVALENGTASLCRPTQVRNPTENWLICWVRTEESQLSTPQLFRFLYLMPLGFLWKRNRFSLSLGRHKQVSGGCKEGPKLFAAISKARVSSENDPQCTQQFGFTGLTGLIASCYLVIPHVQSSAYIAWISHM